MSRARVIVVAPGRSVRGGITSVVRAHEGTPTWSRWGCEWIETLGSTGGPGKAVWAARAFLEFMRQLPRAELVHIHLAWKNGAIRKLPFVLAARASGKTVIVHWHAPDLDEALAGPKGAMVRYMLRHADRVVALSEYWRSAVERVVGVPAERIRVIPNPVSLSAPPRQPDAATILFAGKLEERKGVHTLVRAFEKVRACRPDAELRLAGDNTQFLARFRSEELAGVRTLGWLSRAQLGEELRRATCLCLPSRGEGVPMAVLEAMAAGCPVVATSAGGLVDVVRDGENAIVVPVDDEDYLARSLLAALGDGAMLERIALAAQTETVRRHGPAEIEQHLRALYSEFAPPSAPEGGGRA